MLRIVFVTDVTVGDDAVVADFRDRALLRQRTNRHEHVPCLPVDVLNSPERLGFQKSRKRQEYQEHAQQHAQRDGNTNTNPCLGNRSPCRPKAVQPRRCSPDMLIRVGLRSPTRVTARNEDAGGSQNGKTGPKSSDRRRAASSTDSSMNWRFGSHAGIDLKYSINLQSASFASPCDARRFSGPAGLQ